ncbi:MAG: DUF2828 domain-containing protein, partial [Firmicutes bacterium]|nr:DUF2828 domain-containing protein [Bacillota bacterium]
MPSLNELFSDGKERAKKEESIPLEKYNKLQLAKMKKKTENADDAFNTTGNPLLDILFMTPYFEKRLNEVKIG